MSETQTNQAVQQKPAAPGGPAHAGGNRAAFMRDLASHGYEQQVQMVRPDGAAPSPSVATPVSASVSHTGAAGAEAGTSTQAGAVQFTGGGDTGTGSGSETVKVTWPTTPEEYLAHINKKFKTKIQELKTWGEEIKSESAKAEKSSKVLKDYTDEIQTLEKELADNEKTMTEKELKKLKGAIRASKSAQAHKGSSMEELRAKIESVLGDKKDKLEAKKVETKAERIKLSQILLASIKLGSQLNPEFAEDARSFYMGTLDKEENGRLVAEAKGKAETKEVARLAVMYRNAAKDFVRQEIMVSEDAREVLYLRDLGVYGRRTGLNFEEACKKAESDLKIDLDSATTEEQRKAYLERIYQRVIGKSKETNAGANAATGADKKKK